MRPARERLAIVGASGHGVTALDAARMEDKYEIAGFIESNKPRGTEVAGLRVLGSVAEVAKAMAESEFETVLIGISDNWIRHQVWEQMRVAAPDLKLASVIHPSATVADTAVLGEGALVLAGAVINPNCVVGENCIINTKASLDHDSRMHSYSSLLPGATIAGNVEIGRYSCICAGAVVSHKVIIGEHVVLGAGAVALSDIPDGTLAYGTPAKAARQRSPGERHF